jgi:aminoglycoside 3-N-acetyltransferase
LDSTPILVHTDIARLDRRLFRNLTSNTEILNAAIAYLKDLNRNRDIWLPSFNYGFAQTRVFDVKNDVCEVGIINEALRRDVNFSRSETPIFSIIRNKSTASKINLDNSIIEPFGPNGEFAELFNLNGEIMLLGANLNSLTQIHWIEELAGVSYRYYKDLPGEVRNGELQTRITLRFRVRPKGMDLQYDWDKLNSKIVDEGIILFHAKNVISFKVANLRDFLIQRLLKDELWMLTQESRRKVEDARNLLGRNYQMGDF